MNPRAFYYLLAFVIGIYIAIDSKKQGSKYFVFWFFGAIMFPFLAIPIYFFFFRQGNAPVNKDPGNYLLCPKCGFENEKANITCTQCENQLVLK
jgi:hypothetical protein